MSNTKVKKIVKKTVEKTTEVKKTKPVVAKPVKKGYTVRTKETGDKVYLIKDKKKHWIKNPETLRALGFWFGDEKTIKYKELVKFEDGKPIDLSKKETDNKETVNELRPIKTVQANEVLSTGGAVLGYKEEATLEDFEKYND